MFATRRDSAKTKIDKSTRLTQNDPCVHIDDKSLPFKQYFISLMAQRDIFLD